MSTQLKHGPHTKGLVRDSLHEFLYAPELLHFKKKLHAIVTRNSLLIKAEHNSCVYKGTLFNCEDTPPPRRQNRLSKLLYPMMEEYLNEVKRIDTEEVPYVMGFIIQVLNQTYNQADWFRIFPEAVHPALCKISFIYETPPPVMSDEQIEEIKKKNEHPIMMMRQRLVMNLLY